MALIDRTSQQVASLALTAFVTACGGAEPTNLTDASHATAHDTGLLTAADTASPRRQVLVTGRTPSVDALLNWAERTYPQFFPGTKTTLNSPPYQYRYYPETDNYVGVAGTQVYILGPVSSGALQSVGQLSDFACLVTPRDCVVPRVERVAAGDGVAKFVLADGRVGLLGEETYPVKYSGLFPGSVVKMVDGISNAVSIRSSSGGQSAKTVILTANGDVFGWGSGENALGQIYKGNKVTTPVKIAQLSNVVDVSLADGNMTMALRTDGTVWVLPGVVLDGGQVQATRVPDLPKIRAIFPVASFSSYLPTVAVDESGQAWVIKRALSVRDAANRRTLHPVTVERMLFAPAGIQQIACTGTSSRDSCLAVVADGSIKAWGTNGGTFGDGTMLDSTLPVSVKFPVNERVRKISLRGQCALALTESGKLYYWGGDYIMCSYVDADNMTLVPTAMYSGVDEFAVDQTRQIVVVSTSGQVFSWGGGSESLGDGRTSYSKKPIPVLGINLN